MSGPLTPVLGGARSGKSRYPRVCLPRCHRLLGPMWRRRKRVTMRWRRGSRHTAGAAVRPGGPSRRRAILPRRWRRAGGCRCCGLPDTLAVESHARRRRYRPRPARRCRAVHRRHMAFRRAGRACEVPRSNRLVHNRRRLYLGDQDRARDVATAERAWSKARELMADPSFGFVILDELNIVLRYDYLILMMSSPRSLAAGRVCTSL